MHRTTSWTLLLLVLLVTAATSDLGAEAGPSGAQVLLTKGDELFQTRDYAGATEVYKQAVLAAEAATETSALVEALSMVARGYLIQEQKDAGQPWLDRAAALATASDPQGWSRFLGVRGRFEWKNDDKPAAMKTFEAMYAFCVEHDLWSRAVDAAHMVAIVGTHEQQIEWARKGIAAAEKGEMDGWLGPLWNNLGNTYDELKRPQEALDAWIQARHYHWKVGTETSKLVADWAVGLGHRKVGDYKAALQWQRPVLAWAERRLVEKDEPERREWVALAKMELGLIALHDGRKEEAAALLEVAYPPLRESGMAGWHPAAWVELETGLAQACPQKLVALHVAELREAIDAFRMQNKRLPRSLKDLTIKEGGAPKPYLSRIPVDPWGNAYGFHQQDGAQYELRSVGPDGVPETVDDIRG